MAKELFNLLGLAQRAGKVASGEAAVKEALLRRKACLLIITEDAGKSTRRKFAGWAEREGIPVYCAGTSYELGLALGRTARVIAAVTDPNFARRIEQLLRSNNGEVED